MGKYVRTLLQVFGFKPTNLQGAGVYIVVYIWEWLSADPNRISANTSPTRCLIPALLGHAPTRAQLGILPCSLHISDLTS